MTDIAAPARKQMKNVVSAVTDGMKTRFSTLLGNFEEEAGPEKHTYKHDGHCCTCPQTDEERCVSSDGRHEDLRKRLVRQNIPTSMTDITAPARKQMKNVVSAVTDGMKT